MDKKFESGEGRAIYSGDWISQFKFLINPHNRLPNLSFASIDLPFIIYKVKTRSYVALITNDLLKLEEAVKANVNRGEIPTGFSGPMRYSFLNNRHNLKAYPVQLNINFKPHSKSVFIRIKIPTPQENNEPVPLVERGYGVSKDFSSLSYPIGSTSKKVVESKAKELLKTSFRTAISLTKDDDLRMKMLKHTMIKFF